MTTANSESNAAAVDLGGIVSQETFSAENRSRLSGPGLRTFLNIATIWQLSERERILVLGSPARSTYHNWVSKAQAGRNISLPLDTLLRISAILGIHKDIRILFEDTQRGVQWLRAENAGLLFGGQRPIDLILSGTQMGILELRRFLDSWRGGISAAPIDNEIEDRAWSDEDIVVIDA
jgi:hypothetical protein